MSAMVASTCSSRSRIERITTCASVSARFGRNNSGRKKRNRRRLHQKSTLERHDRQTKDRQQWNKHPRALCLGAELDTGEYNGNYSPSQCHRPSQPASSQ
jgi:hypothetical protein